MFENKKILILGLARSGYECAKVLAKRNNEVIVTDIKDGDKEHLKELKSLSVKFIKSDEPSYLLDESFDYVIKNPGVKIDHPLILKAQKLGIKVTNEVEVAYKLLPKDITIIGITGSNGKTTTTTLIYEMMKKQGLPVHLGGNIGYPVCSLIDKVKPKDILVLEISSHQLHDLECFKTNISVMTNLSEVHLDHFKTYEYYKRQKFKIFNNHTKQDLAILNLENNEVVNGTKNINSTKKYFSSKRKSDVYLKDNSIYYNDELIINTDDIKIKGIHNYENIMAAILVVKEFNVKNEIIKEYLKEFSGVEHRIEFVREVKGVKYYNDSKATNTLSTTIALSSFNEPTILLLGGLDRNHSFEPLLSYMKNVKCIISYGETRNRIKEFADKNKINVKVFETLSEATKEASKVAQENDVVLLSPACASWDEFTDFEERGNTFKKIINSL